MDTARSNLVRNALALMVAFAVGVLVANPSGFIWRVRYWIPAGDRAAALGRLVEAEPTGAGSELSSAIESDDADLRFSAAGFLARRGEKRGIAELVRLADAKYPGAREQLEGCLVDADSLEQFETAGAWYAATHHSLHFEPSVRWSGSPVN